MSATMFIYRGLPLSGKTTDAEAKRRAFGGVLAGRIHLHRMLFGAGLLTHEQRKMLANVQRNVIRESLRAGENVYVDDRNLHDHLVRDLVKIAEAEGAEWVIRDFTNVPLDRCLKRNALRDRKIPEHVIRDMHKRFIAGKEYPLPFE
jgi:predicted kinase